MGLLLSKEFLTRDAVVDVDAGVRSLEAAGGTVAARPRRTEWGYRAVVRDPGGRAVEVGQE